MDTRSIKRNYRIQQWKAIIREEALKQPSASGFVELSLQADNGPEISMVTLIPVEKPAPSQLTLSVNGITIQVTENTSSALLAKTIGVIKNAQ